MKFHPRATSAKKYIEMLGVTVPVYPRLSVAEDEGLVIIDDEFKGLKALYHKALLFINCRVVEPMLDEIENDYEPTDDEVLDLEDAIDELVAPLSVRRSKRRVRQATKLKNREWVQGRIAEAEALLVSLRQSESELSKDTES